VFFDTISGSRRKKASVARLPGPESREMTGTRKRMKRAEDSEFSVPLEGKETQPLPARNIESAMFS
jgi:hypothetical protein